MDAKSRMALKRHTAELAGGILQIRRNFDKLTLPDADQPAEIVETYQAAIHSIAVGIESLEALADAEIVPVHVAAASAPLSAEEVEEIDFMMGKN